MAKKIVKKDDNRGSFGKKFDVSAKTDPKKVKKTKRNVLLKFKLSASIGGYKAGQIITLSCDRKSKSPKDRYWRRRLRDAEVDNCIARYKETN